MPAVGVDFVEVNNTYRGTKYVLREVDAATFDKCVEKATETNFESGDPMGEETLNQKILVRQLLLQSLIEPKLTAGDINKLGVRLVQQLERDVRDLHFDIEPNQKTDDEDDGEGNAEG